jgi:hypothetical protein
VWQASQAAFPRLFVASSSKYLRTLDVVHQRCPESSAAARDLIHEIGCTEERTLPYSLSFYFGCVFVLFLHVASSAIKGTQANAHDKDITQASRDYVMSRCIKSWIKLEKQPNLKCIIS